MSVVGAGNVSVAHYDSFLHFGELLVATLIYRVRIVTSVVAVVLTNDEDVVVDAIVDGMDLLKPTCVVDHDTIYSVYDYNTISILVPLACITTILGYVIAVSRNHISYPI